MMAVLFSACATPQQQTSPQELVRYVYMLTSKAHEQVLVQYREFDGPCRSVLMGTRSWAVEEFEKAIAGLKRTGLQNGQTVALSESSGSDLPTSFLKIKANGFKSEVYAMYLRSRWAGLMPSDPVLDEWRNLLHNAAPAGLTKSGIDSIKSIANDCAKDWPAAIRSRVCMEARETAKEPDIR